MRAVTRDDGGYELLLDGPGSYAVLAQSGDGRAGWPNRTVEVPEADSFTLDLDYGGVPVAGVVVDRETERPVPGAGVWASRRPGPRAASAIAGADGRFQLDLDPGDYQVAASADGYGQARAEVAVGDSGVPDLRLALDRGHTLAGRVVDARGRGVGGISVDAVGGDGREASYGSSETLPDGTFRMGGLEPIPHTVSVGSDLAGFALQGGVEPGQGPVTLTLKPGGRVRVVVRDAGGAPVADAWCYVRVVGGLRTAGAIAGTHTDATGVADFLAPVGEVQVSATTRQATGHVTLTVAAGEVSSGEITLVEKPAAESE
jgi:hypothetical protein